MALMTALRNPWVAPTLSMLTLIPERGRHGRSPDRQDPRS